MNKLNIFFAIPLLATLSSCASAISGATQEVTLLTPGSYSTRCILENGNRYKADNGVPVTIMKSENDLIVDCYGSDNRHRRVVVESKINGWAAGSAVLGAVPAVYDHLSKGGYEYPEIITVDFIGVPGRGYELPQYHDKDMQNPYEASIESYAPNTPKTSQDSGYLKRGMEKTGPVLDSNPFIDRSMAGGSDVPNISSDVVTAPVNSTATPSPMLKGGTAEELTRSMNPSIFGK